jgi:rod shape-determining protein MreB
LGFASLIGAAGRDIAVDLGTANTLVFVRGRGIVLSEPSVIAIDSGSGRIYAVGSEAKRMIGRTPASISAIRPLRHGVIADFEVTEQMLRYFIRKADGGRFGHPRVVMCAPSGATDVEKRAINEACLAAGARKMQLIEEPLAAAIGADLPIEEPSGSMVVDVGGGTTEVAVLSLGGIVVSESVRVGGYDLDEAIVNDVRRRHNLAMGQQSGEELKIELGSAWPVEEERSKEIRGRDLVTGLPREVTLTSEEVRLALSEPVAAIIAAVRATLERTPPELAADIVKRGITLAGGGSLLLGFDERLRQETKMPVYVAEDALECVALGAGRSLDEFDAMERGGKPARRRSSRRVRIGY